MKNLRLYLNQILNTKQRSSGVGLKTTRRKLRIVEILGILMLLCAGETIYAQCADPSPTGDCDGDLVLNAADLDDDNDGILDVDENCTNGNSELLWGFAEWSGGDPEDDESNVAVTTINGIQITADNTATDFANLPNYEATSGTRFNGKDGLLLQAAISEFLVGVNSIRYRITFDTPVTGLEFRIVDIDRRITGVANEDPFIDRVTVSFENGGVPFVPTAGVDYIVGAAIDDKLDGSFEGLFLVDNTTSNDADIIYALTGTVDEIFIEFTQIEPTTTTSSLGNTAFLISDMQWDCAFLDTDGDSILNEHDVDSDNDGCPDALEGDGGLSLSDLDVDNSLGDDVDVNGVPNIVSPGQNDLSSVDPGTTGGPCDDDNDTLTNADEEIFGTDPLNPDTDGDGVLDGVEVTNTDDPLDPCDPTQSPGYTGYEVTNSIWRPADCDGDGETNISEVNNGTDPYLDDRDDDEDGVPNGLDACPNTPANAVVDVDGCEVFSLPNDNFSILTNGETCRSNNDGSIELTAATTLNYTASLTGDSGTTDQDFTDSTSFTGLTAGDYTLCITVEGEPDYEVCFDITITEPEALGVSSKVSSLDNKVTLDMSGGKIYYIELNGQTYQTQQKQITLPLDKVANTISVRTDKDCQGIYTETITLNSKAIVYQNAAALETLSVFVGQEQMGQVEARVFSISGVELLRKSYPSVNSEFDMDIAALPAGVYILNVKTEKSLLQFKFVKR